MCKSAPNCLVENAVSESIASAKLSMARERLNVEQLARVPLYAFAPFCSRKTQKAHSVLEERFSAIGSFSLFLASASQPSTIRKLRYASIQCTQCYVVHVHTSNIGSEMISVCVFPWLWLSAIFSKAS